MRTSTLILCAACVLLSASHVQPTSASVATQVNRATEAVKGHVHNAAEAVREATGHKKPATERVQDTIDIKSGQAKAYAADKASDAKAAADVKVAQGKAAAGDALDAAKKKAADLASAAQAAGLDASAYAKVHADAAAADLKVKAAEASTIAQERAADAHNYVNAKAADAHAAAPSQADAKGYVASKVDAVRDAAGAAGEWIQHKLHRSTLTWHEALDVVLARSAEYKDKLAAGSQQQAKASASSYNQAVDKLKGLLNKAKIDKDEL